MSYFNSLSNRFNALKQSRHFKYGFPFLSLVIGGSFLLREFQQAARYDNRKSKQLDKETIDKLNLQEWKTTEEIYEEYKARGIKKDYQMVRGPRPWEPETVKENLERRRKAAQENQGLVG